MRTASITHDDWKGVFAVPPLARNPQGELDWDESEKIARHIVQGGVTRLLYGGNAFLYHMTLAEYEALLGWLAGMADDVWCIPSAGPSYGRLMDQAPLLKASKFPCVMHLPCGDPRDAAGLARGLRAFSRAAGMPLVLYLKDESNFGADREAGLDALASMVRDGTCIGIKYAVVREDPASDSYLTALLDRVDRSLVVSGIGERPAIVHLRDFLLPGYTTGSGCIGSALTQRIFAHCQAKEFAEAGDIREKFLPLEDLRDAHGPARVLHAATEDVGIARCGPVPPFVSTLSPSQREPLADAARMLIPES